MSKFKRGDKISKQLHLKIRGLIEKYVINLFLKMAVKIKYEI